MKKLLGSVALAALAVSILPAQTPALNTPFPYSKGVASHLGGLQDGMVVSWPARLKAHGEMRTQFTHVTDIAPTLYEAAGIAPPETIGQVAQMSLDGVSFAYSFTAPDAPERHRSQYFEMLGDRSCYRDGWLASTKPVKAVWDHGPGHPEPLDFEWALYDLRQDYAQAVDLAARYPARLKAMQVAFDAAARANNVYPLRADFLTRLRPTLRPSVPGGRRTVSFHPGPTCYSAAMLPPLANAAWEATAVFEVPEGGGDGTPVAQGGWPMGWGLFVDRGRPLFLYRPTDHDPAIRLTGAALAPGRHSITGRFAPDGPGGTVSLTVDGTAAGSAPVARRWTFSNLPASVGMLGDDVLAAGQTLPFAYPGKLGHVTITAAPLRAAAGHA